MAGVRTPEQKQVHRDYMREYNKAYYVANKDKVSKSVLRWKNANREVVARNGATYRDKNKDRIAEVRKAYREANSKAISEKARERREKNPQATAKRLKQWADKNKNKCAANYKRWYGVNKDVAVLRAKIRTSGIRVINELVSGEWAAVVAECSNTCIVPGCSTSPVTMDHVVPLSKGGRHHISNLQPLCSFHNGSKGVKDTDYRGVL